MSAAEEAIRKAKSPGPWKFVDAAAGVVEEPIIVDAKDEFVAHCVRPADGPLLAAAPEMAELLAEAKLSEGLAWGNVPGLSMKATALLSRIDPPLAQEEAE